jgi:protein arginine N-methyltransferase 1
VYSVFDYGRMVLDEARMRAYFAALDRLVQPGAVVVDVGAGTGVFSLYACTRGARRVYAIEPNPAIDLLAPAARENGFADRIEIFRAPTEAVELPERADVIVWDVRGQLGLLGLDAMVDARRRFLAPGGALVPLCDRLMVAFVESAPLYDALVAPWDPARFGFSQRAARDSVLMSVHTDRHAPLASSAVLSEPREWAAIDFATVENGRASGTVRTSMTRDGTAHALALWFETELADGIGFSTGPAPTSMVYARMVLPLFEPLEVHAGDEATISLSALPSLDDYVWSWNTEVSRSGARIGGFRQSSFFSDPLAAGELRRTADAYAPSRSAKGEAEHFVVSAFDGARSIDAIATSLAERFPALYRSKGAALAAVKELARRLGR